MANTVLLLTTMPLLVLGCKCVDQSGKTDDGLTRHCCHQLGGLFLFGNDCFADTISEELYGFGTCCGDEFPMSHLWRGSDCEYPEFSLGGWLAHVFW
ncbi:hypothetical protein CP532_7047 [Ophiocordyceps camponoti-leonardi (nom. inval.)]|nr:hypothetical protein CP532_7047 [Ophiocordyceps camponoti-leonardi (nom. inval.)]